MRNEILPNLVLPDDGLSGYLDDLRNFGRAGSDTWLLVDLLCSKGDLG